MAEHCAEYATVLFKVNFPPFCTMDLYFTIRGRSNRGSTMGASKASSGWDFGTENLSSPYSNKKVTMRSDLNLDEQREWEKQEMEKPVDFSELHIDPAPFQLVEKSSLLKVGIWFLCFCLHFKIAFLLL